MEEQAEDIARFYAEAFSRFDTDRQPPPINVEFYPYVGINHTIRIRNGTAFVRIAEICRDMPEPLHRALAYILVGKLYRRKAPKQMREAYEAYLSRDEVRDISIARRRKHGRKIVSSPTGETYDLSEMFDDLNRKYFWGTLKKPTLSWSRDRTYRILGHHDAMHETIIISRSFDSAAVPRYVVEYVLYHEMLHIFHPTVHANGRRYNHTAAFKRDEKNFEHYEKAESWIEKNSPKLKRSVKAGKRK